MTRSNVGTSRNETNAVYPSFLNPCVAAEHLKSKKSLILQRWETLARQGIASAKRQDRPTLRNSLPELIDELIGILTGDRNVQVQAPRHHAQQRSELREYSLAEVIEEYHLLRRVIFESLEADALLDRKARSIIEDHLDFGIEESATYYIHLTQKALQESEALYRRLVQGVKDYAILGMDPEGRITSWNAGAERIKGYTSEEVLGRHFSLFYTPEDITEGKPERSLAVAREKGQWEDEGWRARKDGSPFWAGVVITAIYDETGQLQGFSKVTRDLSEWKRMELERSQAEEERQQIMETLYRLATRDSLTGLYNRREMDRHLQAELQRSKRYGSPVSLIMIDIDHFKRINDSLGHQAGDKALQWVAHLIEETVRKSDHPARYGGDELAILLPETTVENARALGERLRKEVEETPFSYRGKTGEAVPTTLSISLGVAGCPVDAETEEGLLHAADRALYRAKEQGRNRVRTL